MMQRRHRSIGERLRSAKSPEAKRAAVTDWARAWRREQEDVSALLDAAIQANDRQSLISAAGQLHEITSKRFDGLDGVVCRLTEQQ